MYILSIILGTVMGIFTGIAPAIHINTVAFVISLISISRGLEEIAVFMIAMSISHNFFDFLPAIIFGSGEEGSALSSFAGNRMFLNGEGMKAVKLTSFGGLIGACAFLAILPALIFFLPKIFTLISSYAWILLAGISAHLILKDGKKESVIVFALSGILGGFSLNSKMPFPLLSLFSGLFGLGVMWDARNANAKAQIKTYGLPVTKKSMTRSGFLGVASSLILGVVPAIGPTQASLTVYSEEDENEFLIRLGAINVSDIFVSLLTLFLAGKARSGVLVVLKDFIAIDEVMLFNLFLAGFLAAILSFYACMFLSSRVFNSISKINYPALVKGVILLTLGLNFAANGFLGLFVCIIGAGVSRFAIKKKVMKSQCMGCLIIPTLFFYVRSALFL